MSLLNQLFHRPPADDEAAATKKALELRRAEYRATFLKSPISRKVLADMLDTLGFGEPIQGPEDIPLHNFAVNLLAELGMIGPGLNLKVINALTAVHAGEGEEEE